MSLRTIVLTIATALVLFGCASADGQSPTEGDGQNPAAHPAEGVQESSYLAQCNAACVAGYDRALATCEGNGTCLCEAGQNEGACLAACAGRRFIRRIC